MTENRNLEDAESTYMHHLITIIKAANHLSWTSLTKFGPPNQIFNCEYLAGKMYVKVSSLRLC